ncbi:MAG: hypothetical protein M1819_003651 [Sarea resinae]|nr:MAG: hypothetical protein M1819_003651 [Sarea resinae]
MPERSTTSQSSSSRRRATMPIPELQRRASASSPLDSKTSLPYPTFSKAHSREAVGSRESVANPQVYTPDATDVDWKRGSKVGDKVKGNPGAVRGEAPPSPPLTAVDPDVRKVGSRSSMRRVAEDVRAEMENGRRSVDSGTSRRPRDASSKSSLRKPSKDDVGSKLSSRSSRIKLGIPTQKENQRPVEKKPSTLAAKIRDESPASSDANSKTARGSSRDSQATSRAPIARTARSDEESSPASYQDSSPRTPTPQEAQFPPIDPVGKGTPVLDVFIEGGETPDSLVSSHPPPPPPPPPPTMPMAVPRVDYLLQNGGLSKTVPRSFMAGKQIYSQFGTTGITAPMSSAANMETVFAPFSNLLEDYTTVLSKKGSLAVATGYKSVARRLLDRLEAVFARNISSETCHCPICEAEDPATKSPDETGVSWGEVLELTSGRRDLPDWPPFSLMNPQEIGLGINARSATPCQNIDIDVPEEYRHHYIAQSKKTKTSVDKWLASQPENPSSPPPEVDDDTLTFAILTRLEPAQKQAFTGLLGRGALGSVGSRAPTPLGRPRPDWLIRTGVALQRLYHLSSAPRDPESAIFLLNNPHLHGALATLAAVSSGEWDVLISGRFDGFLWSGAEEPSSRGPSRGPGHKTNTPFSPNPNPSLRNTPFRPSSNTGILSSRGPTPAAAAAPGALATPSLGSGGPIPIDEETEIAVLAEIEREIYTGMESLEDAFEALHHKAEAVRQALRQRGAGLALAQSRRGTGNACLEVRMNTPASCIGGANSSWGEQAGGADDDDDGFDDGLSELAPDDSASNLGFANRGRRPRRKNERWTPAPVEEEDEEDEDEDERDEERVRAGRGAKERASRRG